MISKHEIFNEQRKCSSFDVYHKDDFVGHFVLPAFGHHNIMNALGVIAVAYFEKLDMQKVAEEMLSFKGVKRRFSEKKSVT